MTNKPSRIISFNICVHATPPKVIIFTCAGNHLGRYLLVLSERVRVVCDFGVTKWFSLIHRDRWQHLPPIVRFSHFLSHFSKSEIQIYSTSLVFLNVLLQPSLVVSCCWESLCLQNSCQVNFQILVLANIPQPATSFIYETVQEFLRGRSFSFSLYFFLVLFFLPIWRGSLVGFVRTGLRRRSALIFFTSLLSFLGTGFLSSFLAIGEKLNFWMFLQDPSFGFTFRLRLFRGDLEKALVGDPKCEVFRLGPARRSGLLAPRFGDRSPPVGSLKISEMSRLNN